MSTGTVGWWVICLYLRSVGLLLSVCIITSLVLMQLSQNYTFLWLTFWIKNRSKNATNVDVMPSEVAHEGQTVLDHGFNVVDSLVHGIFNASLSVIHGLGANSSAGEPLPTYDLKVTKAEVGYSDSYYLEMYFVLAGLNVLFTVMRAFLFAYGGVKAAGKIHKILVKVIIEVSYGQIAI